MILNKKLIYSRKTFFVREGGRRVNFFSCSVSYNLSNIIGFGFSKSNSASNSFNSSVLKSDNNSFKFKIVNRTFPSDFETNITKTKLIVKPSFSETGLIAGGLVRKIISLTGVKNIYAKIYGSKNKLNVIKCVLRLFLNFRCE